MDNRTFARPIVILIVLGMLILSIICCVGTFLLISQRNAPDTQTVQPTQVVVQPQPTAPVVILPPNVDEAYVCAFAQGFTSEGKAVPAGTVVIGPAVVKPNRDLSWGFPLYVGEEYTTIASDEVVWPLTGDNICVDAQAKFFQYWGKTAPK